MPGDPASPDRDARLWSIAEVMARTTLRCPQVHRLVAAGSFPAPAEVIAGHLAWSASEVAEWIGAKLSARTVERGN